MPRPRSAAEKSSQTLSPGGYKAVEREKWSDTACTPALCKHRPRTTETPADVPVLVLPRTSFRSAVASSATCSRAVKLRKKFHMESPDVSLAGQVDAPARHTHPPLTGASNGDMEWLLV
eukprot:83968-Chlamydomonas_euryale.AAC.3